MAASGTVAVSAGHALAQRERAGYALRVMRGDASDMHLRATTQQQMVHRLGVHLPLLVLADMEVALGSKAASVVDLYRGPARLEAGTAAWRDWCRAVRASDAVIALTRLRPSPGILSAITVRIFRDVIARWPPSRDQFRLALGGVELDPRGELPPLDSQGIEELMAFFGLVELQRDRLDVALARLDLDTIRLLSILEHDAFEAPGAEDLARLLAILDSPSAHDVVNFALELLPSVMESRSAPTARAYAVNGYRGLTRSGSIDDLMLTELAYDDDIFLQRFVDRELFYHDRERTRDNEPERHLVLIDATAGMRGLRETFARGVALAFVQQLVERRKTVFVAFFDSGLHRRVPVRAGTRAVTYLLGFDQGRGRDYDQAFRELTREVQRMRDETRDDIVVTFITHGRCLVPRQAMLDLVEVCKLHGIFVLPRGPSGEVGEPPEYAHLLSAWQVVDEESLSKSKPRLQAARSLLGVSA